MGHPLESLSGRPSTPGLLVVGPAGPTGRDRAGRLLVKGAVDRVVALLLLAAGAPLLLAVASAVRLTSPGPVIFRQERVGRHGRPFTMYKFRSMVGDAPALLVDLHEHNDHGAQHVLFKMADDPRVTRVGRWLRRYSLDELPQLVNVLRGEMSLVGPRPHLPSEVLRYDARAARRLTVMPGLTGLWQVSGRSDLDWERSVALDLHYVDHWSLALDLDVLARTVTAVLSGRGAR